MYLYMYIVLTCLLSGHLQCMMRGHLQCRDTLAGNEGCLLKTGGPGQGKVNIRSKI